MRQEVSSDLSELIQMAATRSDSFLRHSSECDETFYRNLHTYDRPEEHGQEMRTDCDDDCWHRNQSPLAKRVWSYVKHFTAVQDFVDMTFGSPNGGISEYVWDQLEHDTQHSKSRFDLYTSTDDRAHIGEVKVTSLPLKAWRRKAESTTDAQIERYVRRIGQSSAHLLVVAWRPLKVAWREGKTIRQRTDYVCDTLRCDYERAGESYDDYGNLVVEIVRSEPVIVRWPTLYRTTDEPSSTPRTARATNTLLATQGGHFS